MSTQGVPTPPAVVTLETLDARLTDIQKAFQDAMTRLHDQQRMTQGWLGVFIVAVMILAAAGWLR